LKEYYAKKFYLFYHTVNHLVVVWSIQKILSSFEFLTPPVNLDSIVIHMSSKLTLLLVQTLFFFLAITLIGFLAEVVGSPSRDGDFCLLSENWCRAEFTSTKNLLRLAASGSYVLFRNRRLLFNQG